MMKTLLCVCLGLGIAISSYAQSRAPASLVSVDTTTFTTFTNGTTVQTVLKAIDTASGTAVNYAPTSASTNHTIEAYTPRWIGDMKLIFGTSGTNCGVWMSSSTTTSSWFQIYPVQTICTTNQIATNIAPYFDGQMLQIDGAWTNILWRAFANTNGTYVWKAIYRGTP